MVQDFLYHLSFFDGGNDFDFSPADSTNNPYRKSVQKRVCNSGADKPNLYLLNSLRIISGCQPFPRFLVGTPTLIKKSQIFR